MAFKAKVRLSVEEAARRVIQEVTQGSLTAQLVEQYTAAGANGTQVCTLVFEKYYLRTGNTCALSVTLENLSGTTAVFAVGAGARQGAFSLFDWGASQDFEGAVEAALEDALC